MKLLFRSRRHSQGHRDEAGAAERADESCLGVVLQGTRAHCPCRERHSRLLRNEQVVGNG